VKKEKKMIKAKITKDPAPFEGDTVTICVTSIPLKRDGFHTQISVQGRLEKHPDDDAYRVVWEDSTYAYFKPEDVEAIVSGDGWATRTGSTCVIYLKIGGDK
jgi:hypothetical protein